MAIDTIPPWIAGIQPSFFTSALEAGARTGLALTEASQRAQQMAEARAEREAQQQERQAQDAERQREFEASHLLNVQKVAQDAAQLQQQTAHQTALEAGQRAQESRLLNYDTGRLAVEQQKANQAGKVVTPSLVDLGNGNRGVVMGNSYHPLAAPETALDTTAKVMFDPITGARIGLTSREGPHSQRFTPDAALNPDQTIGAYNALITDILKELDSIPLLAAALNPDSPKRARYEELQQQLDAARKVRGAIAASSPSAANAPTVLAPAPIATPVAPTNAPPTVNQGGFASWYRSPTPSNAPAARIRVRRKSDGKTFTYPGAAADVPTDRYEVLP
jgi:multidrug efflux pump subunit AcrA (membrane-fusion protein)